MPRRGFICGLTSGLTPCYRGGDTRDISNKGCVLMRRFNMSGWLRSLLLSVSLVVVLGAAYLPNKEVQIFSPDGRATEALTGASTTSDDSKKTVIRIYTPVTCYRRHMPTSAKGSYPQVKMNANSITELGINVATPFTNLSGCTGGTKEGM